jgi:PAS domain S-box-containing protein
MTEGKCAPPIAIVVNDDPTQRKVLTGILAKREGLAVRDFESAEAALEALVAGLVPALIVTDLYMPGIDGWQFCHLLRSPDFGRFNATPILVVSATFSGEAPAQITGDLGANAFLPQPVDPHQFLDTVNALLHNDVPLIRTRVLIVEDNPATAEMLRKAFEEYGYHTDLALTGREALEKVNPLCNIAVLDYHLPDVNGDELLLTFRHLYPACAVVMMTGDTAPELAVAWMKAGAAAYVLKPHDPKYLVELCARASRERALLMVEETLEQRTRELRESEAFNAALFDYSPIATMVVDREGRIVRWNRVQLRANSRSPVLGSRMYIDYAARHDTDMRAALMECIASGKTQEFPEQKYGNQVLSIKIAPFPSDNPSGAVIAVQDITERERMAAQLLQQQKLAAIGSLAGGVAHNFNNLLMGIMNHAELCRDKLPPDHPTHAFLDEITRDAQRSADLTQQLLGFARKQTVAPKVLDLNDTAASILKLLRSLIGENIEFVWDPAAALWPVRCDALQIDQILTNLCTNARDAINGVGTITLETANVTLDKAECARHVDAVPGEYALLTVNDNGCGMDKETVNSLFEPFFTTKDLSAGAGLGLATVYGIVKQNNGFINVDSEPGQGTTFGIYLPRSVTETATSSVTPQATAPGGTGETILLVDDDKSVRVTCGLFLKSLGYTVLMAETPAEALKAVAGHPGDLHLLLTDVIMPGMDGRQLSDRVRAVRPGVKVLFMSGYTADMIAQRGVLEENVAFIGKPFTRNVLAHKVRRALGT